MWRRQHNWDGVEDRNIFEYSNQHFFLCVTESPPPPYSRLSPNEEHKPLGEWQTHYTHYTKTAYLLQWLHSLRVFSESLQVQLLWQKYVLVTLVLCGIWLWTQRMWTHTVLFVIRPSEIPVSCTSCVKSSTFIGLPSTGYALNHYNIFIVTNCLRVNTARLVIRMTLPMMWSVFCLGFVLTQSKTMWRILITLIGYSDSGVVTLRWDTDQHVAPLQPVWVV